MSSLSVKGSTKCWEAHERDQLFVENERIYIGKSQRLRKEGNARINTLLAMRKGLAKIIEKVCISWCFESTETDLHIADNACSTEYADTWSSNWVHWLPKSHCLHCGCFNYWCQDTLEVYNRVAGARLLILGIYMGVDWKTKIPWLPATLSNTRGMFHFEECYGSIEAIPILDPVDVED